jgi:hypothetical protein
MANTFTTKFRLCRTEAGALDWHLLYYDAMNIIDAHIPRIFMSAPRVITIATAVGGALTANQYYFYKVVAVNGALVTLASWENTSAMADATNKTINISWSAVAGVTKYRVYRADTPTSSYIPIDSDYNYLAEVTGSTLYSDTGGIVPSGAMPSSPTWYTTEINQLYVMPDAVEGQTAHVTPVTLIDNLDNIRNMVHQLNGRTNWDDAVFTSVTALYTRVNVVCEVNGKLKLATKETGASKEANTQSINFDRGLDVVSSGGQEVKVDVDETELSATLIPNVPAGKIVSTNLQGAINELDGEKIARDGTQALTANWSAGDFQIIARNFQSSVGVGTAPMVVASTTKVSNFNADKVDDQEGSYYLARANHTGTQPISTLSDHNKANHDALGINAATLELATKAAMIAASRDASTIAIVIEARNSDPGSPSTGRIWLRTDL